MASLSEIVGYVQMGTDWAPTAAVRTAELWSEITRAELEVWGARSWVAAQGVWEFEGIPDWTPELFDSAAPPTCTTIRQSRKVVFSVPLTFLFEDASGRASKWVGQVLSLPTVTTAAGGAAGAAVLAQSEDYVIVKVESATTVWLDRPYEGVSSTLVGGWRFKWVWYRYPSDCLRPTAVWLGDEPMDNAPGVWLRQIPGPGPNWSNDPVGVPSAWVEGDPWPIPSGGRLTVALGQIGARDDTRGLPTARFYEVAWAWLIRGQLGAPGTPLKFSTGVPAGSFVSAQFTMLEADGLTAPVTSAPNANEAIWPLTYEGWQKVLLVNGNIDAATGDRLGPPRWSVVNRRELATTQTDADMYPLICADQANVLTVKQDWQMLPSLPRVLPSEAGHEFRIWPRSDGFELADPAFLDAAGAQVTDRRVGTRRFRLHYIRKPNTMCAPSDGPYPLPVELHDLVALKATELWARRIGRSDVADSALARYESAMGSSRVLKHQSREGYDLRRGRSRVGLQADAIYNGGLPLGPWPWVTTTNLPTTG